MGRELALRSPRSASMGLRVVLSDVLGSKDVVEGRDIRTRRIVSGRICVKTELHAQIHFYVLPLVNTVG
jgi:hypothetical protein